jgi:coatomer protein complex subunit alpha (xenin)
MIVFKLERERPAYASHAGVLYYVKDRYLRTYDYATQRDNPLISIRRPSGAGMNTAPRGLSYNPAENAVLLTSDADGGSYELYMIPKDTSRGETAPVRGLCVEAVCGGCCLTAPRGCCNQAQSFGVRPGPVVWRLLLPLCEAYLSFSRD